MSESECPHEWEAVEESAWPKPRWTHLCKRCKAEGGKCYYCDDGEITSSAGDPRECPVCLGTGVIPSSASS